MSEECLEFLELRRVTVTHATTGLHLRMMVLMLRVVGFVALVGAITLGHRASVVLIIFATFRPIKVEASSPINK